LKKIALTTLGCKANQYDTECIAAACRNAGFEVVDFDSEADAYVINTCTVTAIADQQARQMLRRAKRNNPDVIVIAVGCSVQNNRQDFEAIDEIDAIFGVRSADEIVDYLLEMLSGSRVMGHGSRCVPTDQSRARALLKIQDGCDRRCTYCAVWKARGKSTSVALENVREGYRALSKYPEVMITGIHIGQYGDDLDGNVSMCDLIDQLASEDAGPRIRLSSLNPDEFDDRFLALLKKDRVCRHVHLSVQSLANPVIKAMGRSYLAQDVARIVREIYDAIPGIAIGADIIAGFPGESDESHRATVEMIEKLPFSYLHVFPYSIRPGTKAAEFENQVSKTERKERAREIMQLANEKKKKYYEAQIGEIVEAVVVSREPDACGRVRAVADNYITVVGPAGPAYGTIARARIEGIKEEEVRASWC